MIRINISSHTKGEFYVTIIDHTTTRLEFHIADAVELPIQQINPRDSIHQSLTKRMPTDETD